MHFRESFPSKRHVEVPQDKPFDPRLEGVPKLMSRRELPLMGGAFILGTTGVIALAASQSSHAEAGSAQPHTETVEEKLEQPPVNPEWWRDRVYRTPAELVNQKVGGLEVSYLRPDGMSIDDVPLPPVLPAINFSGNLNRMLVAKGGIIESAQPRDREVQQEVYKRLSDEYEALWERDAIRRMDLKGLYSLIEQECISGQQLIADNSERIVDIYFGKYLEEVFPNEQARANMNEWFAKYIATIAGCVTPTMMLSYLATELMPVPERSAAVLEFLTQNAGVEYLERIPALGDSLLSYGPFQLTKFVIDDANPEARGSVTQLLHVIQSNDFLPSKLSEFTSFEQHARGGYLFAVHNLIALAQETAKKNDYDGLLALGAAANMGTAGGQSTVFLEQLSAAHHRPEVARDAMTHWLTLNKHITDPRARDLTLANHFPQTTDGTEVATYAQKARASFGAIAPRLRA